MKFLHTIAFVLLVVNVFENSSGEKVVCPGEICEGEYGTGCCTKIGLQCCPDGLYCVKDNATMCGDNGSPPKPYGSALDGPAKLLSSGRKLLSLKETQCPNGVCEEDNWFCCADNNYCAETERDCPNFSNAAKKLSNRMFLSSSRKLLSLKDTKCPNGMCEEDGWFCCADDVYCAETESDCPNFLMAAKKLVSNLAVKGPLKQTVCPNGTCEEDGWFCCEDGIYCAESETDCPNF